MSIDCVWGMYLSLYQCLLAAEGQKPVLPKETLLDQFCHQWSNMKVSVYSYSDYCPTVCSNGGQLEKQNIYNSATQMRLCKVKIPQCQWVTVIMVA